MALYHSADAWLQPALRHGAGWSLMSFLAGLGAPMFFLALGAGMAVRPPSAARDRQIIARGFELILIGYLLRLQFWVLDHQGLREPGGPLIAIGLFGACLLFLLAVRRGSAGGWRAAAPFLLLGAALLGLSASLWPGVSRSSLESLLFVDVLQVLGLAAMVAGLLWRAFPGTARPPAALALTGAVLGLATLLGRFADLLGRLPGPLANFWVRRPDWAIGKRARFPLLPWFGYVLVGTAVGHLLRRHADQRWRAALWLGLSGLLLIGLSWERLDHGHQLVALLPFAATSVRVVYRTGFLLVLLGLLTVLPAHWQLRPLSTLGRASLFLYWIHLWPIYGVPGRPLRDSLSWGSWGLILGGIVIAFWLLARFRLDWLPGRLARLRGYRPRWTRRSASLQARTADRP